jgi:hypothetical protein
MISDIGTSKFLGQSSGGPSYGGNVGLESGLG